MATHSDQACKACKKGKRRCDKGVPECGLCRRNKRLCEYGIATDPQPTTSDWSLLQARLTSLENRLADSQGAVPQPLLPDQNLTPASDGVLGSSTPFCEPADAYNTVLSSAASLPSLGVTPAYSGPEGLDFSSHIGTQFPASMFLDIDCYVWSRTRLPSHRCAIPTPVLALLGQGNVVLGVSQDYFTTIHTWFPIVSKKRMDMGLLVQNAGPDLAMLFLSMKLITAPASDVADCDLYTIAKSFLARLETHGVMSLLCLQAMMLVGLYEYGHAIYPAAWMTIGACARYSDALGLTPGDYCLLGQVTTWTESEERRRVWWGVFILDRIVSMGSRRRSLVPEPQPNVRLPVGDEVWDSGEVSKAINHPISTAYQVEQSGFTRLCQASIYLGRAMRYARDSSLMSTSRSAEIMSLAHEITGFGQIVDNEGNTRGPEKAFSFLTSRCIARSALFVLLDRFTCPEKMGGEPGYIDSQGEKKEGELELQKHSMQIIELASEKLHDLGMGMLSMVGTEECTNEPRSLGYVSPFIMDSMYAGAATFHWLLGESGKEIYRTAASDLEMLLGTLNLRWRLGGTYREMLSMHDVLAKIDARAALG